MKELIKKILPKGLKDKLYSVILAQVKEKNKLKSSEIPKYVIEHKHIENTKLLVNRQELLKRLPLKGTVAELGVDKGDFSEEILHNCKPQKLHLVDLWGSQRYNQNKRKSVEEKFKKEINSGIVEINIGLSTDVGKKFQDNYFDWIYIDTDHSYQTTIKELEIWRPKMKTNGIIAGHDYIIGNWDGIVRYGVIEAVYEFCSKYNWEIIYLSTELDLPPSFAIRKIME